jgi:prepilin-type N-terminal cleavage/methylation domain-containing protein
MRTIRRHRGFTLIELLIVISIILVILEIAIPHMDKQIHVAREMAVIR